MQRKLTLQQLKDILSGVKYKNWTLRVIEKTPDVFLLQWIFYAIDNNFPESTELLPQHCRKWYISAYSTDSEVIRSAWLAVHQAEAHEIDENFTYQGCRIFNPHADLVALSYSSSVIGEDVREEMPEKEKIKNVIKTLPVEEDFLDGETVTKNTMGKTEIWHNGKRIGSQG